jgi:membrane-bound lytic murein transglycosylase F
VANKDIQLTVADSNIAQLNRRYYPDVRMAFPVSEKQSLGWGIRKEDQTLRKAVNDFLATAQEDGTFARIYQRYYASASIFDYVDVKKFHQRIQTRLPKYEATIKNKASEYGFDWRLIAAVIYQESHFDPHATSYTGVRGLMQVTQDTARKWASPTVCIRSRASTPESSICFGNTSASIISKSMSSASGSPWPATT